MGRRTGLLIAAVLIAAIGTALILMYVQGIDARAVEGQERVEVLAATEIIESGENFSDAQAAGKIDTVDVIRDDMVAGAISSADGLAGRVALSTIYPGEQLLPQKFGEPGDEETLTIPDDKLAVSVQLTDPARVAGFVTPGSQVAIFLNSEPYLFKPDGEKQELPPVTSLLLPEVQVIGVGATSVQTKTTKEDGEQTTEEVPKTILTLAVTQEEAEKVLYGAKNGELAFALRTEKSKVGDQSGTIGADVIPVEAFQ